MFSEGSGVKSAVALLTVLGLAGTGSAQTITSSVVGSVVDVSNLPVAAASVTLTHVATGAERQTQTDERGDFVFPSLQRGDYILTVNSAGFKRFEKRSIRLSAQETLPVGTIALGSTASRSARRRRARTITRCR